MGWVYNLHNPNAPTQAPRLIAIAAVFSLTALLAVALRFYARITFRKTWIDDYTSLVSVILLIAYSSIAIAQTRWGQGLDSADFPPEDLINFGKIQYAGGPFYTLALLGFKLALLFSYLRIAGFVQVYRKILFGLVILCICNQITFTLLICLTCVPVAKIWDSSVDGHCTNSVAAYYAIAGSSLALDVLIILLPIPVLIKLRLNTKQKFVLVGMFATGFFVTVIQIIRIFTIKNLKSYANSGPVTIWSIIEISLGIIVPCVPTFSPLIRSFSNSLGSGSLSNPRSTTLEQSSRDTAVRNKRGTNKSYTTRGADMTYGMGRMKSSNAFTTIGHHDRDDASSEEAIILQGAALQQHDEEILEDNLQIRTTTTVKVESHSLNDGTFNGTSSH